MNDFFLIGSVLKFPPPSDIGVNKYVVNLLINSSINILSGCFPLNISIFDIISNKKNGNQNSNCFKELLDFLKPSVITYLHYHFYYSKQYHENQFLN